MPYTWNTLKDGIRERFVFLRLDIVSHSKIVENNPKDKVSNTLDKFENWVEGYVAKSGGQLWTWHGDGGLAAFFASDGVEKSVTCAFSIIKELSSFNSFESEITDKIKVRIAVHLGDVTYKEQRGRIHSSDINFVSHMEEEYCSSNDICISRTVYTELSEIARQQFKGIGLFQGVQLYSKEGQIRDKALIHVDHRGLSPREERLRDFFHDQLRIFSTTADNYFANTDVYPLIREKVEVKGCKLRLLLLDPSSEFMKDREHQEKTNFIPRQNASIANIMELKKSFPQQVKLRFFNCSPPYQALIIDNYKIFIAINTYGITGTADFPCIEIANGPETEKLFLKFIDAFEKLWKESKEVCDEGYTKRV